MTPGFRDPAKPQAANAQRIVRIVERQAARSKPRARGRQLEATEQRAVVLWLESRGIPFASIPNEARRSYRLAARLKASGLRAGAPDLVLWRLAADHRPVAIEMKAVGGRVSTTQLETHATLEREGWHVVLAFGADDCIEQLAALGY